MDEESQYKRLFFAFEVQAPWPEQLPKGRLLREQDRHLTFAFLGHTDFSSLQPMLQAIPLPPFKVGLTGKFDKIVFLPKRHPRVVAWHLSLDGFDVLPAYRNMFITWLQEQGFTPDDRQELTLHVTLCRAPFQFDAWRGAFHPLPCFLKSLHLYESIGQLHYQPVWSHPMLLPFEELDHTADIAFKIRGETVTQLFFHALSALAFKSPEMIKYNQNTGELATIDEVVIRLNQVVAKADAAVGCPFKAVSFHGEIVQEPDNILTWEMIVDV